MKRKIFSFLAAAAIVTTASAQSSSYYDTRHEVGITIGSGATTEIFNDLADFTEIIVSTLITTTATGGSFTGNVSYGDESYIPTISAEYYYHVSKLVGLGGFVAFNGMDRDMYANWKNNSTDATTKEKIGKASRRNLSIVPTAKFDWLRKKYIGMYSKLGMSVSFMHESQKDDVDGGLDYSDTETIFNVQVSLLGIEAGSRNIRGFAELGMGEQGILLAGVRYKF
jgi:hypothetical protein